MSNWFRRTPSKPPAPDIAGLIARADSERERGLVQEAIDAYQEVHDLDPTRVYALYWLATLHQEAGRLDMAADFAARGLALDPRQLGLLLRAADIAKARQDHVEALRCYEAAREADPAIPMIDALIADQLCHAARVDEGIAAFRRALSLTPDNVPLQQNLLFVTNFSDAISATAMADEHRAWGLAHERALAPTRYAWPRSVPRRARPRIGYVSPDLRNHAVSHFVDGLFAGHREAGVDYLVFDLSQEPEDEISAALARHGMRWLRLGGRAADEVADAIRKEDVDILVDLAGHTNHNRLLAFARKPAPVQVSWLGYLQTTGLTAMDYRFTDAHMDPVGMTEKLYTEELVRLPVQACFSPRPHTPEVSPLRGAGGPALRFGSVNNWSKSSPSTRRAWGALLQQCPDAELVVVARGGQHASVREAICRQLVLEGARADQVAVQPVTNARDFLAWMGTLDVVLDPWPYGGGTTTMHALYMGVPVVTLAGDRAMARNSIGPLHAVGLADLVTGSPAQYVARAIALGRDRTRLHALRSSLRSTMRTSAIMNAPQFARSVESAYDAMWRRFTLQE